MGVCNSKVNHPVPKVLETVPFGLTDGRNIYNEVGYIILSDFNEKLHMNFIFKDSNITYLDDGEIPKFNYYRSSSLKTITKIQTLIDRGITRNKYMNRKEAIGCSSGSFAMYQNREKLVSCKIVVDVAKGYISFIPQEGTIGKSINTYFANFDIILNI